MTDPPKESVFSGVVSRESVRIALACAALNGLDVSAANAQNACLNALTKEAVFFRAGLEFGEAKLSLPVEVIHALHGLKSGGARW